eukprot:COSAG02_NODE_715_length_18086_cov_109.753433_13_plen_66_part_00
MSTAYRLLATVVAGSIGSVTVDFNALSLKRTPIKITVTDVYVLLKMDHTTGGRSGDRSECVARRQ